MNDVRTVLVISYWFAPSPAVGAKRFSFLSRELGRLGYDVHVIAHEAHERVGSRTDDSLPLSGQVHRCSGPVKLPRPGRGLATRAINALLRRWLAPVGWEIPWAPAAVRRALEVARRLPPGSVGVVIATAPPYAAVIAGARVARELGWPLIIDYRDPWSAFDWPRWRRSRFTNWIARLLERQVVRESAARVLNTPAMRASYERYFPATAGRNFVIPNGFDPQPEYAAPRTDGPIVIVHAGEIFTGRSLLPVLAAARNLSARFPGRPVRVINYGGLPAAETERIRAAGLEGFIEVRPRIPFAALAADLQRAHVLLAVVGEHMPYSTPYKVYDYMAAGRPILGIAPGGAALFELLAESGAGQCVEPGDAAGIERTLGDFLSGAVTPAQARLERFHWANLASQYQTAIEAAASKAARPRPGLPPAPYLMSGRDDISGP